MPFPTAEDVQEYLGETSGSYSEESIDSALAAELAAQGRLCAVVEDTYPVDLREALLRRVVRNLHMRDNPLGIQPDSVNGSIRLSSSDPEVRRLEGPHRRVSFG